MKTFDTVPDLQEKVSRLQAVIEILNHAVNAYMMAYGNSNNPNNPSYVRDRMIESQAALEAIKSETKTKAPEL